MTGGIVQDMDCSAAVSSALRYGTNRNICYRNSTFYRVKNLLADALHTGTGTTPGISATSSIGFNDDMTYVGDYGDFDPLSQQLLNTQTLIGNINAYANYEEGTIYDHVYAQMRPGDALLRYYYKDDGSLASHAQLVTGVELVYDGDNLDPNQSAVFFTESSSPHKSTYKVGGETTAWTNDETVASNMLTFTELATSVYIIPVTLNTWKAIENAPPADEAVAGDIVRIPLNSGDYANYIILDPDHTNNGNDGIFLVAEDVAGKTSFANGQETYKWAVSQAKQWCETYMTTNFSLGLISLLEGSYAASPASPYTDGGLDGDKVFFLSHDESQNLMTLAQRSGQGYWWVRDGRNKWSLYYENDGDFGSYYNATMNGKLGARPAINLDYDKEDLQYNPVLDTFEISVPDLSGTFSAANSLITGQTYLLMSGNKAMRNDKNAVILTMTQTGGIYRATPVVGEALLWHYNAGLLYATVDGTSYYLTLDSGNHLAVTTGSGAKTWTYVSGGLYTTVTTKVGKKTTTKNYYLATDPAGFTVKDKKATITLYKANEQ